MIVESGDGSIRIETTIDSDWGAGHTASVAITNLGGAAIDGWTLDFAAPFSISNLWNGRVTESSGGRFTVVDAGWNETIQPGQTVSFGYQAGPLGEGPTEYALNGIPLDGDGEGGGDPVVPAVTVGDVLVDEGDAGSGSATFDLTLDQASAVETRLDFRTEDGSATAGEDYRAASGEVVFAPGETAAEVLVDVFGDLDVEGDETFRLVLENGSGLTIADGVGEATIANDDAPVALPVVDVADGVLQPGTPGEGASEGFFGTSGNQIVDADGNPVKLAGVNWFGMETTRYAPDGLFARNYKDMMDQMVELGFNTIRLPFSNDALDPARMPTSIDYGRNPELAGLTSLEVLDAIVDYAGEAGLRIILDNHRINAGDGAEGIWFGNGSSEAEWIADWQGLAARYAGNPTVIGADLFNEPHLGRWGDPASPAPDFWNVAAEKAGNAIHEVNSDWLILVEGVGDYQGDFYWWGGQLEGVADFPVQLDQAGKLVYSPHAYPNSIFSQPWFSDPAFPDNLPARWTETWGFIHQQDIAPVLLGEFGSRFEDPKDLAWLDRMQDYLAGDFDGDGGSDLASGELGPSWTWWSWNPNSGDTGGILADDWETPIQAKVDLLEPLMFDLDPAPTGGGGEPAEVTFEITLSEASGEVVTVDYETTDDTAVAGQDYVASSGTVSFQPGETAAEVAVQVIDGGAGAFGLLLNDPSGATLGDAEAVGSIDGSGGGNGDGDGGSDPDPDGDGLGLDLVVRVDWGSGFVADVTVSNQGDEAVDGWAFLIEMPNDIVNIWNADIASDQGDGYVIDNASYNGDLPPGRTATLGFQGSGAFDPTEVDLTPLMS